MSPVSGGGSPLLDVIDTIMKPLSVSTSLEENADFERCGMLSFSCGRCGGLMVSALVSGSSGPASSPGRGHCVVFLGKTLYSHSALLHPGL